MEYNNFVHCRVLTDDSDIFKEEIYFVHESDRMSYHEEMMEEVVKAEMEEEIDYRERSGYELPYNEMMEMESRIKEDLKNRFLCWPNNRFALYKN